MLPVVPTAKLRAAAGRARWPAAAAAAVTLLVWAVLHDAVPAAAQVRCADATVSAKRLSDAAVRAALVCLINRYRTERGLPPLSVSPLLNRAAQGWTDTMVSKDEFGSGDLGARVRAAGVNYSTAGENIATGLRTPRQVFRAWLASTYHCQNILSPTYRQVGTGVIPRPVRGYASHAATWTQDFALPVGKRPPSGNSGPADGCPY